MASPKARHYLRSLPPLARADLGRLFPAAPAPALALLATLLAFSPRSRPGAADALAHPWLAPLRDARDEPVFGGGGGGAAPLELPQLAADGGAGLDADALRALVRQEAALFGDG